MRKILLSLAPIVIGRLLDRRRQGGAGSARRRPRRR